MRTITLILLLGLVLSVVPAFAQGTPYLAPPVSQLDTTLDGLDLIYLLVDLKLNQEQVARVQQMVAGYQQQQQEATKTFVDELGQISAQLATIRETLLSGGWPKGQELQAFSRALTGGNRGGRAGGPRVGRGGPGNDPAAGMMRQFREVLSPQQRLLIEWEAPDMEAAALQPPPPDQNAQQLEDTMVRLVAQAADTVRFSNKNAYIARRRTEAQNVLATLNILESDPTYARRFQQLQDLFADVRVIPEEEYGSNRTLDRIHDRAMQIFGDTLPGGAVASGPIISEAEVRFLLIGPAAPLAASQRLSYLTSAASQPPTP